MTTSASTRSQADLERQWLIADAMPTASEVCGDCGRLAADGASLLPASGSADDPGFGWYCIACFPELFAPIADLVAEATRLLADLLSTVEPWEDSAAEVARLGRVIAEVRWLRHGQPGPMSGEGIAAD